ncbi:transcriptional regulator, LysR family [Colwellia chukchiensis]|uniref:Transcriptional regulator, LysR family n=1 Tax=Colwellia chukchiensis TaxID=641665 RepID=A0A1H7HQK6_9GAMM|nr:hydrogen peroxide-inducible genes activator [Colwellia chukchiensis]SEK51320.1 transcriptional regulator, LysR family [Colwellia chukchiensis]
MYLPNLKHLRYLVALHQHQHFHKAAQACFVSQSTLSSAILKLEQQLNCQLIERDNKSFLFTNQGNAFVEKARKLLVDANDLVSFAKQQGQADGGVFNIGCIPTIAPYLLTDLVPVCQQALKNLLIYFREDTTDQLLHLLKQGELDAVILALPIVDSGFESQVVGKDHFYAAGAPQAMAKFRLGQHYQSLPEHSVFLLSNEHCLTRHAIAACNLADTSRINPFSATSLSTLVQMTAYHQGFTFLPEMAVNKGLGRAEGLIVEPLASKVYREIALLRRATSAKTSVYQTLSEILQNLLK